MKVKTKCNQDGRNEDGWFKEAKVTRSSGGSWWLATTAKWWSTFRRATRVFGECKCVQRERLQPFYRRRMIALRAIEDALPFRCTAVWMKKMRQCSAANVEGSSNQEVRGNVQHWGQLTDKLTDQAANCAASSETRQSAPLRKRINRTNLNVQLRTFGEDIKI